MVKQLSTSGSILIIHNVNTAKDGINDIIHLCPVGRQEINFWFFNHMIKGNRLDNDTFEFGRLMLRDRLMGIGNHTCTSLYHGGVIDKYRDHVISHIKYKFGLNTWDMIV